MPTPKRISASRKEGIGLTRPATRDRKLDHRDPEWYVRDLDGDDYLDRDEPHEEPLPTDRHRAVPGFPSGVSDGD
jgi:hypothetical protein